MSEGAVAVVVSREDGMTKVLAFGVGFVSGVSVGLTGGATAVGVDTRPLGSALGFRWVG